MTNMAPLQPEKSNHPQVVTTSPEDSMRSRDMHLLDARPELAGLSSLRSIARNSPQSQKIAQLAQMVQSSLVVQRKGEILQRVSTAPVVQMKWYDCFLSCLPFLKSSPEAAPLLNAQTAGIASDSRSERAVEVQFRNYLNSDTDYEVLQKACADADIGGVCTALTVDWFSQILKSGNFNENPVSMPAELKRLVKEHQDYRGKAIKSSSGMSEYLSGKGMAREQINSGYIVMETGEIGGMDEVELVDGGMYMLDFGDKGSEGIGHTIGLYKQSKKIIIRDQNVGQQTVETLAELAEKYSLGFADIAKKRKNDMSLPLYRKWTLYQVNASR